MSVCGITGMNDEQKKLIATILDKGNKVVFGIGPAGTGKTFVAIASALQMVQDRKYADFYYGRDAVTCGTETGFVPGDEEKKIGRFFFPLVDSINNMNLETPVYIEKEEIKFDKAITSPKKKAKDFSNPGYKVKVAEIEVFRGRSFKDTIIIIDECQNMDYTTIHTIITRMGKNTKLVMLGCYGQIDSKTQDKNAMFRGQCDFELIVDELTKEIPDKYKKVELYESIRDDDIALVDEILTKLKYSDKYKR